MDQADKTVATDYIDHGSETYRFLPDPVVDALVQVVVELGSENWITRRRLLVLERVLTEQGVLDADATERYVPTSLDQQRWRAERDRLVKTVYDALARPPQLDQDAAERAKGPEAPKRPPRHGEFGRNRATGPSGF